MAKYYVFTLPFNMYVYMNTYFITNSTARTYSVMLSFLKLPQSKLMAT